MSKHEKEFGATHILHILHRASQSADDLLANRIAAFDLTPRQLTVLEAIQSDPDTSQTALVNRTGIDRSTLADIVRRLVEAGFAERERMEHDARMYSVRLTELGRATLAKVAPIASRAGDEVLGAIPEAERLALLRGLQGITDTLGPVASARVSARAKSLQPKPISPTAE
ncbi:MAG: MarR family winged helix-turn-helix transcriptional regulator [Hyphomicrobiaceae bacterium]